MFLLVESACTADRRNHSPSGATSAASRSPLCHDYQIVAALEAYNRRCPERARRHGALQSSPGERLLELIVQGRIATRSVTLRD